MGECKNIRTSELPGEFAKDTDLGFPKWYFLGMLLPTQEEHQAMFNEVTAGTV